MNEESIGRDRLPRQLDQVTMMREKENLRVSREIRESLESSGGAAVVEGEEEIVDDERDRLGLGLGGAFLESSQSKGEKELIAGAVAEGGDGNRSAIGAKSNDLLAGFVAELNVEAGEGADGELLEEAARLFQHGRLVL
jgi:hypothetical protein